MMSDTPERWMDRTTEIMREMYHAMRQSVLASPVGGNPDMTEQERRDSWLKRAEYLRDRAKLCITNAFNDHLPVTGDADDTSHQTVRCERCGGVRKEGFFMPCVCKDPHPALVKEEE